MDMKEFTIQYNEECKKYTCALDLKADCTICVVNNPISVLQKLGRSYIPKKKEM